MRIRTEIGYVAAIVGAAGLVGMGLPYIPDERDFVPRGGAGYVNWENPHVHPLEMTPDGQRLLAVNTAAAMLEVFNLTPVGPVPGFTVPVGIDPVAVRSESATRAWVVNHISDTVSIVDLSTRNVVATLRTLNEPADVVFAGTPRRAFVSCSQANTIQVFDPANLAAAPLSVAIVGEDPRSLAVSPDGTTVYAAIFESGNNSTVLGGAAAGAAGNLGFPPNVVNNPAGPHGGVNPPPNDGTAFEPPLRPGITPLPASLIVRKDEGGAWRDDTGADWTSLVSGPQAVLSGRVVGWNLVDHDLAAIDATSLSVSYATGLMNICMAVGVNPATGDIAVVGTEATNELRFEPNITGTFLRVNAALVNPDNLAESEVVDLNPHLDYTESSVVQSERDKSIGDPRAIVFNSAGTRGYVAGMGSNNVIVIDTEAARAGVTETIEVGEGPTGLALDESRGMLYVLNKFDGSVSTVDVNSETEMRRLAFFDPTPGAIKIGRKHLYDTHKNSGLGQIACASCHVDSRTDRLGWDLGDPSAAMAPLTGNNLGQGLFGSAPGTTPVPFQPFHPMKGPMTTQTLQDIIGKEPLHWRGDRAGIENFSGAFIGLQGDDVTLTDDEMQEFEDFLATIHFPPNPFRNFDNTLPTNLAMPGHLRTGRFGNAGQPLPNGNAASGLVLFRSTSRRLDGGAFACVTCHTLPTGMGTDRTFSGGQYVQIPPGPNGERHHALVSVDGTTNISTKTPHLRNMYEKTGFNALVTNNTAGFGVLHDGSVDSIERFVAEPVFNVASDQEVANLTAFLLAFAGSDLPAGSATNPLDPPGTASQDTHAAVGAQVTVVDDATLPAPDLLRINQMITMANANKIGLIVKGLIDGEPRGLTYMGANIFQQDRGDTPPIMQNELLAMAAPGSEITYTAVPLGSQIRYGIDRDEDGTLDGDEIPACEADFDGDGFATGLDFDLFVATFEAGDLAADFDGDGFVTGLDFDVFVGVFEAGC